MEELFVPFEIALELKEKGFKRDCFGYYYSTKLIFNETLIRKSDLPFEGIMAPMYQQVVDWLREDHHIIISVNFNIELKQFYGMITIPGTDKLILRDMIDYHKAFDETIREALKSILRGK
jgi:hypothetical protein